MAHVCSLAAQKVAVYWRASSEFLRSASPLFSKKFLAWNLDLKFIVQLSVLTKIYLRSRKEDRASFTVHSFWDYTVSVNKWLLYTEL